MVTLDRRVGILVFALAALAVSPALSAPRDDVTGEWKLEGSDDAGAYSGTAQVSRDEDGAYSFVLAFKHQDGAAQGAVFKGAREGKWFQGRRTATAGVTGALDGRSARSVREVFGLSDDGLELKGTYGRTHESLKRAARPGETRASIAAAKEIILVPGAPGTFKGWIQVDVTAGEVTLDVKPEGALKVNAEHALGSGSYKLEAEPAKEGAAELRLVASDGTVVASAPVQVVKERLYLLLFGCADINFLPGDVANVKAEVLPKLRAAGYTVIEDGPGYDQGVIDRKLDDPASGARKVVVDWCTSDADWEKYFDRASIKGYTWHSHGAMEPFTGCPDDELEILESRVFTTLEGQPDKLGTRHFMRQFQAKLEKNAYPVLDFGLHHACCTGGIGEYGDAIWDHCERSTRARVDALFAKLPGIAEVTFRTFDELNARFGFHQTFNGSAISPMFDVRWDDLEKSIRP